MTSPAELLPRTLDLLILKSVSLGRLHGYAVLLRIEQITGGALHIQGALYPALYHLGGLCAGRRHRHRDGARRAHLSSGWRFGAILL